MVALTTQTLSAAVIGLLGRAGDPIQQPPLVCLRGKISIFFNFMHICANRRQQQCQEPHQHRQHRHQHQRQRRQHHQLQHQHQHRHHNQYVV